MSEEKAQSGWYIDPMDENSLRYWDGSSWTVYSTRVNVGYTAGLDRNVPVKKEELDILRNEIATAERELSRIREELAAASHEELFDSLQLTDAEGSELSASAAYRDELAEIKGKLKRIASTRKAYTCSTQWRINNSSKEGERMADSIGKLALRAYNTELDNLIQKVRPFGAQGSIERADKAKAAIQKFSEVVHVVIDAEYHGLRCEELKLMDLFRQSQAQEKEDAREQREKLKEEKRVEAELAAERQKLEDEMKKTQVALESARVTGDVDTIAKLEALMAEEQEELALVDHRRANLKCGSVYVISNVGSLGPGVVKIGMTRRQYPEERVKELSGTSVPFPFVTHATFYADNAFDIEARLHRIFKERRVNKVNTRREFFYAQPREVLEVMRQLGIVLTEFHEYPTNDEYDESKRLARADAPLDQHLIAKEAKGIGEATPALIAKVKSDRVSAPVHSIASSTLPSLPSAFAPTATAPESPRVKPVAPPVAVPSLSPAPLPSVAPANATLRAAVIPSVAVVQTTSSHAAEILPTSGAPLTRKQMREMRESSSTNE
jgi:hypothetical protein